MQTDDERSSTSLLLTALVAMNITLRDLLRWPASPLVAPAGASGVAADQVLHHPDRPMSWPVTMRATAPMLPHVESGALVLVPQLTLNEVRPYLPGALHELRRREVAALVVEPGTQLSLGRTDLDLLWARQGVTAELELSLTRLINERRARLYRLGTEIDRALTEATLRGRSVVDLLRIGVSQLGQPLLLLDEQGRVQEACLPAGVTTVPAPPAPPAGIDLSLAPIPDPASGQEWLLVPLDDAARGWLAVCGQRGHLDEADRLLSGRIAAACALAQVRRGTGRLAPAQRATLVGELLDSAVPVAERQNRAELLGFDATTHYAVVCLQPAPDVAMGATALTRMRRLIAARIAPLAEPDEAQCPPEAPTTLLLHSTHPESLSRAVQVLRGIVREQRDDAVLLAVSALTAHLAVLPELLRQTHYALAVLAGGVLAGPFADWQELDDLGAFRLLYPLWGTPAAQQFVAEVLGDLPAHEQRHGGELLPTLLIYLRHGGAAGAAANELAIHRNTLTYRLRRIEEICQRSPLDPRQQLMLHLAAILATLPAPAE